MTQPGGNAGSPYGGYGGALQNYGQSPAEQQLSPDQQPTMPIPTVDQQPTMPIPTVDRQAPPTRIDPYVGPPLPPPVPAPGPAMPYQPAPMAGAAFPGVYGARTRPPIQRPAVIAMSATLAVTASLQWICGLSFAWLMAAVGAQSLGTDGIDGALYHMLQRFHYGMIDGLAWPLYLFPTAAFVTGFLVLIRRPWARIVHSAVGAGALAWSAWWLYETSLLWWIAPAVYIAVACLILWLPAVTRWYRSAP
ncbi:hypothetical protein [Microlunatus speluncae]|uniref:hypothetical protein n=1 Tax=Microlunatus speluncae TaxID=2594267 RepID=UPI0012661A98|nr:hypothetical protein [Microlunatus speluncae]